MKISNSEKLIIQMLADIMKYNEVESDLDPVFISEAISGGHHWALESKYSGLLAEQDDTEEDYKETLEILDMWSFLENAYENLGDTQKGELTTKAHLSSKDVKFGGFDGNNESEHWGIARFLIEKMGRYTEFKGRELNSHGSRLQKYRGMLKAFPRIRSISASSGENLTVDDMAQVLTAKAL